MFEDHYGDVLGKARFGLGLTPAAAGRRAGLTGADVARLERGRARPAEAKVRALATALGLSPDKLADFARRPEPPRDLAFRVALERVPIVSGIAMNAYVFAAARGGPAGVVDPGADLAALARALDRLDARADAILLTHAHADHTGALSAGTKFWSVRGHALIEERARLGHLAEYVTFVTPGVEFTVGGMRVKVLRVPGHTMGSAAYLLPEAAVAFTGDALFARSLGRAESPGAAYTALLAGVRAELLGLPPETILCPGHGPPTTVGDELRLNPFFP